MMQIALAKIKNFYLLQNGLEQFMDVIADMYILLRERFKLEVVRLMKQGMAAEKFTQ